MPTVFAPGRVNLIGEHTDYTGGLVLPMALELGVTLSGHRSGSRFSLTSDGHDPVDIDIATATSIATESTDTDSIGTESTDTDSIGTDSIGTETTDIASRAVLDFEPSWARYVLAVAGRMGVSPALQASITSTLPIGGTGLSSSTALTCAALLMYGATGEPLELAKIARQAEIDATGLEIGLMDQAASMACRRDQALLMDCSDLTIEHIQVPDSIEVLVVHSGQGRALADSAYRDRFDACRVIESQIGPLREASLDRLAELDDETLRRRARHVITENQRVRAMIAAFAADDPVVAGQILAEGHASLAGDYEVSLPVVDQLVEALTAIDGIYGARMTGGGFGGSLVAFCEPGITIDVSTWWTRARPGAGARVVEP